MGNIRIESFAHLDGPADDFLSLPSAIEGASEAEKASTRSLLDPANSYYAHGSVMSFVAYDGGKPVGRASAFKNSLLHGWQARYGLLGHFCCENNADYARTLVDAAAGWMAEQELAMMRGPMSGDIWHRWRFMTRGFDTEPFSGEPRQPLYYPDLFAACGFAPVRTFSTKLVLDMADQLDKWSKPVTFNSQRQITYRNLDRDNWIPELKTMCELCRHSFASNWGVTDTTEEEFVSLYDRWLTRCGPDHIIYALDKRGDVVGLGLAIVRPATTINLKTIAVLPNQSGFGLGKAIAAEIYRRALDAGQTQAQHCLIAPDSPVQHWDHGLGMVTREYTIYERSI